MCGLPARVIADAKAIKAAILARIEDAEPPSTPVPGALAKHRPVTASLLAAAAARARNDKVHAMAASQAGPGSNALDVTNITTTAAASGIEAVKGPVAAQQAHDTDRQSADVFRAAANVFAMIVPHITPFLVAVSCPGGLHHDRMDDVRTLLTALRQQAIETLSEEVVSALMTIGTDRRVATLNSVLTCSPNHAESIGGAQPKAVRAAKLALAPAITSAAVIEDDDDVTYVHIADDAMAWHAAAAGAAPMLPSASTSTAWSNVGARLPVTAGTADLSETRTAKPEKEIPENIATVALSAPQSIAHAVVQTPTDASVALDTTEATTSLTAFGVQFAQLRDDSSCVARAVPTSVGGVDCAGYSNRCADSPLAIPSLPESSLVKRSVADDTQDYSNRSVVDHLLRSSIRLLPLSDSTPPPLPTAKADAVASQNPQEQSESRTPAETQVDATPNIMQPTSSVPPMRLPINEHDYGNWDSSLLTLLGE